MAEKRQVAGTEVTEQQAAAGAAQPAAPVPLTMLDSLHWLMNDIRSLREEGNRRHEALLAEGNKHHEALMAEIKALREDGNKHHEESKRRHEQYLERFHKLEKQIWIVGAAVAAVILATGDPENPIVNLLLWLFGIV